MDNKNNDPSNKPLPSLADIAKEAYKNKDNVPSTYSPGISSDTTLKEASTLLGDNNRFGGAYFKQNLDNAIKTKAYQEAKVKAAEQGILGEAAASINQTVVGELIGGTIDTFGHLFDWDQVDTLSKGEQTYGSWLSEIGNDIRDWSKETTPIYIDPDVQAKGFDMGSSEWWFSNLPSVASALTILIPVAGEAKAVSLIGQGLKATKGLAQLGKMGKSAKTVANILDKTIDAFRLTEKGLSEGAKLTVQGLHRAAVSTQLEAGLESVGAFKEEYQRLLNSGLNDEEARKLAGETGAFVYRANWANFATEFMQQMLLLKNGPQLTKGVIGGAEAEAAGLSKKVGRINAAKEYAKQMLSEGAEEAYQHIITQEGKYIADVKAGLVEESSFGDRLAKYTKDGELWTAAFFGGLGGAVFHKFGNKAIAGVNRLVTGAEKGLTAQQARIEELKSQHTRALQAAKNLGEAKESGNTESIIHAENDMALTLGVNAAKNQTLDYMLDRFNNLKNLSKEEREANKIDDNFVESIDKYSKSITQAAALYAENVDRYGADMAESITYREYHLEKLNEQLPRVRKEYDHAVTSLPRYTETTIEGRKLIDETMKLASLHQNKMIIEHVLKTGEMTSQERETQEKNVEILGKAIELTNTQLSEMTKNTTHLLNDADQLVLANLDSKFGQNVLSAKIKNDSYDLRIKNLTDELSFLTSKAGQEQIRKQREDNIKKQQAKQEDKATVEDSEYANENTYTEGVQIAMNGPALEKAIAEGKITEEQIMKIPEAKKVWEAYRKGETLQDTAEEEQKTEKEITEEYSDEGGEGTLFDFPLDNEITEEDKTKGKETITFASNIDEVETPEDSEEEYKIKGPEVNMENSVFTDADETILLSTASALAWKSFNNSQAEDKDFTEQNKAFANFVENPLISLNGLEVRFSIDYENEAFKKQYKGTSPLGEMVGSIKNGKIPENIGLVPIKATFFKNGSPVTSNGHKMEAYLHRDDYAKFKDDSSREEIRRQKNIIVENLLKGNVVSTTLKEKNNGHLRTSKNKETKKFDKRPITEIFPDLKNVEFTIGSNGRKVDPATKQIDGDILGTNTTDGAIYLTVKTANNNKFPLRCNVEKLSIAEAEVIHAIYVSILKDPSTYKQNISPELIKFITENKDERIKDINTYIDLNNISNQDLLDHLVFNGTTKTGHAEGNKLFHTTKNELVFGNKMLPGGVIETEESKTEIIKFLTEKRRRQISVKYLSDDKFKKYIVERGILTTNAVPTENKRLFVQPLLTYDNNFNISKPTVVTKKEENVTKTTTTSDINAKKADIERRIQEVENFVNQDFFANSELLSKHWKTKKDLFENKVKQLKDLLQKGIKTGKDLRTLTNLLNDIRGVLNEGVNINNKDNVETNEKNIQKLADSLFTMISDDVIKDYINEMNSVMETRFGKDAVSQQLVQYTTGQWTLDGKNVEYFLSKETLDNAKNNKQINAKYDAELATLETPKQDTLTYEEKKKLISDIEAKNNLKNIWNNIGNRKGDSLLEDGWAESFEYFNEALSVGADQYQAHGMGKSGFGRSLSDLFNLFEKGIDPQRGGGVLYTAPIAVKQENKGIASAIGTAGGTAYSDGAFILVAKKGVLSIKSINDIGGILVNHALTANNPQILKELRKVFPELIIEDYTNTKGLIEQLNKKFNSSENQKTEKPSVDLKPFVIGNEIRNATDNSVLHTFNTPQEAVTFFETTYLKDIKIETPKVEKQPLAVSEPILQDAFKEEREALENPIAAESEDFDEDSLNEGTLFDINAFLPSEQTLTPEEANNIKEDPKEESDIDKLADEGNKLNEEEGGSVFDPGRWKLVDGNLIKDAKPNYNTFNKEVEHIKSLLPSKIAVKLADDYLQVLSNGRVAIGLFKDNMIHLSKKATEGTAYHEAFHAVYRTMLSYKEQNALYKEASKNYVKYTEQDIKDLMVLHQVQRQDAIEIFYEEQMADDFMDFMKDPNKFSYSKGIKGLFERLLDWLNHVFLNSITRRKLFNDISTGKYKNKPVRLARGVAYKTIEGLQIMPKTGDGFNPQDVPDIIRQLSFIILTSKYPEVKASSREEAKKITKELEIKAIKDELKKLIARNKKEGNEELTYRTFKVFNNLTDLYYLTTEYIESLGLSQEVENQGEDADGNIIYKPSYELSGKENASRQIKMMIALIPKFKVYEVDNFKNRIPDLNTYLGLPKFENFNSVWNRLEKHLTGIVPIKRAGVEVPMFDLMIEKLGEMGKYHPSLAYLKGKLLNTDSFTKSQFTNAFGRYNGVYMDTLVSGKPGNFVYKHANSDLLNVTNNIAKTWSNNFVKNFGIQNNEGKLVYNEAALKQLAFFHNELNMSLLNDKKSRKVSEKSIGLLGAELAFLGIDISEKAIEKLINDEKSKIERTNNEDHDLLKVYDNIFYKLNQALVSSANYKSLIATKNAAARSGELTEETNHILDQTFFKETLAEAEAEFIEVQGENTIPGPDGTTKWISQDHSLMSIILAQVKLGDTSLLESLAKLPFNQSSKWINDLINKPELRQKVKLVNYNNYKLEKKNDGGNKAKDLKEPDQLNDSINKYLNGIYVGLAEADKSQQFYIQGFDLENSQVLFKDGKVDVSGNNAVNILYKYFTSEVNRMVVAYNHLYNKDEKQRLKPEDEIIHYHYKKTPGDKQGNWKISYLFPNMDLQAMGILKYSADETKKDELIAVNGIETLKPEQITEIQKYIKEQFINAVQNDLKILNRYKIIKYQNNTFNNLTIDSNIISSKYQGDVTHAVGDYTLNSIIANVEFQKLFTQDPALFKNKGDIFEDYKKRIPLITASGKLQRIFKEGLYEVREHYQSAVIQNIETPSKYFSDPKNIRAISLATEISEDEIKDMFLGNEWRENKLGAYGKVNQTDAQAWITIDLYRERMLGFGKWSDAMENSFKKIKEGSDTFEDNALFAQPLKTVHSEIVILNGVATTQYNKQSEAVLLPKLVKGTKMQNILDAMIAQKIDHIITLDGKKVGARGIAKILNDETKEILPSSEIKLHPTTLSNKFLFLQQDLPTKGLKDTLVGSQMVKNVLSMLVLTDDYEGMKGIELYHNYHQTISKLSDLGLIELKKEIGFNNEADRITDKPKFNKEMVKAIKDVASDNITNGLVNNLNINTLIQFKNKFQNKLGSMVTRASVKQKQPGGSMIYMSNFGMENTTVKLSDKIVKDEIIWFKKPNEELTPARIVENNSLNSEENTIFVELKKELENKELTEDQKALLGEKVLNELEPSQENMGLLIKIHCK